MPAIASRWVSHWGYPPICVWRASDGLSTTIVLPPRPPIESAIVLTWAAWLAIGGPCTEILVDAEIGAHLREIHGTVTCRMATGKVLDVATYPGVFGHWRCTSPHSNGYGHDGLSD